jgi:hypothetical protein
MDGKTRKGKQGLKPPWPKGVSGNPKGRPKGARHKYLVAMEALLEGQAEGLTQKAIQLALEGDTVALRLCLERLLPARKERPVSLSLPKIGGTADLPAALARILDAVTSGEINPGEGQTITAMLEAYRKG